MEWNGMEWYGMVLYGIVVPGDSCVAALGYGLLSKLGLQ